MLSRRIRDLADLVCITAQTQTNNGVTSSFSASLNVQLSDSFSHLDQSPFRLDTNVIIAAVDNLKRVIEMAAGMILAILLIWMRLGRWLSTGDLSWRRREKRDRRKRKI